MVEKASKKELRKKNFRSGFDLSLKMAPAPTKKAGASGSGSENDYTHSRGRLSIVTNN